MNSDGSNKNLIMSSDYTPNFAYPSWSPDKTKFAYQGYDGGNAQVFVINADGSNKTRIGSPLANNETPRWSPDGTKIVYQSQTQQIRVANSDGSNDISLRDNSTSLAAPDWSPDGTKIVFSTGVIGTYNSTSLVTTGVNAGDIVNKTEEIISTEILVMNADGSNEVQLTTTPTYFNEDNDLRGGASNGPAWSPDGTKIAFATLRHYDDDGCERCIEIYSMNIDGSGLTRLTDSSSLSLIPFVITEVNRQQKKPRWSPDGTKIAFESYRTNKWEIYVMDADGSNQTQITTYAGETYLGDWK
tara:strand:+ start:354 stop:1253 length:900 start_codon:yes stop_codon:yes gene_type:complete